MRLSFLSSANSVDLSEAMRPWEAAARKKAGKVPTALISRKRCDAETIAHPASDETSANSVDLSEAMRPGRWSREHDGSARANSVDLSEAMRLRVVKFKLRRKHVPTALISRKR